MAATSDLSFSGEYSLDANPATTLTGKVSVLDLLNSERNAFGMREKDYERYRFVFRALYLGTRSDLLHRRHCSSKIHRLRQVTGATHGNGKTFKRVDKVQADKVKDVKYVFRP
jgi:signal recognition particle subunit SRP68